MTDVYKEVLCLLIQEGRVTVEEVEEMKKFVNARTVARTKQTETWAQARTLCERLNEGIVANSHRPFVMNDTNVSAMEKLLRIDKVPVPNVEEMMTWCIGHDFWGTVIFSPIKFRKHYHTMLAQRQRDGETIVVKDTGPRIPVIDKAFLEKKRQEHEESIAMPKDFKRVLGFAR